jgi:hypothetical protein
MISTVLDMDQCRDRAIEIASALAKCLREGEQLPARVRVSRPRLNSLDLRPIVFVGVNEPVASGIVMLSDRPLPGKRLPRPDTGATFSATSASHRGLSPVISGTHGSADISEG